MPDPHIHGRPTVIAFAVLSGLGLAMWFVGAGMPESDSAPAVAGRIVSTPLALTGAALLIAAMLILMVYAGWLAAHAPNARFPRTGAAVIAAGAVCHAVENVLVLVLFSGDVASGQALWSTIRALGFVAFALVGLGGLILSIGLTPRWLRVLGSVAGALGISAGVLGLTVSASALAGPFNACMLGWLIAVGVHGDRVDAVDILGS